MGEAPPDSAAAKKPKKDHTAPVVSERTEDRVFALLSAKSSPASPIFRDFLEKLSPRIELSHTSRGILRAFSSPDVNAGMVAQFLKDNPYYQFQLLKVIETLGKREAPSVEGAIVLLGMQNSRNLILALQLLRSVKGIHPPWSKEGKLQVQPNEVLKFALKTEESQVSAKSPYADTAYAAGMLFDVMTLLVEQYSNDKKAVAAFIEQIYAHGLKSAQIAAEISKNLPDFAYRKFLFSACLIHDLGKVAMAILEPDYLKFLETAGKKFTLPRAVRLHAESTRFGTNHAVIGTLICHEFSIFRPIEKSILFHHAPFLLSSRNKNLYQLASLVALSANVANNFKKTDKADDPMVALWKTPELRDFRIDVKDILKAVARVG